jgi:hypothetical protein
MEQKLNEILEGIRQIPEWKQLTIPRRGIVGRDTLAKYVEKVKVAIKEKSNGLLSDKTIDSLSAILKSESQAASGMEADFERARFHKDQAFARVKEAASETGDFIKATQKFIKQNMNFNSSFASTPFVQGLFGAAFNPKEPEEDEYITVDIEEAGADYDQAVEEMYKASCFFISAENLEMYLQEFAVALVDAELLSNMD